MLRHVLSGLRPGAVSGTNTWTNTYNANGMRTKRTDGTSTYEYIYNGDKLVQMKKNGEVLNFTYVGNMPATMTYQGNTFYYVVNAQGDVTGITNSEGKLQVSYTYDAWGRWIYYRHDAAWSDTLGGINPLLYRGYVYDHETQLYYLQSRYYDMNTHRFLNADAFAATGQGFIGNNMFAYCGNNPVNRCDPSGHAYMRMDISYVAVCVDGKENTSSEKDTPNTQSFFDGFLLHLARPRNGGNTFSVGLTGGGTMGSIMGGGSAVLSVDTSHNYALQATSSVGAATGIGGSSGLIMTYTNATDVQDLQGESVSYGGTLAVLAGMSVDYFTFTPKSNPNTTCWGISVIVSAGDEAEVHIANNYTYTTSSWNPFLELHKLIYGA